MPGMDLSGTLLSEVDVAALDIQATGLSPATGHRVVEIAVVRGRAGGEPATWSSLINPERPIDRIATDIEGITDEDLRSQPLFSEVLPKLRELLDGLVLVMHHARYDLAFLRAECERIGETFASTTVFDTLALARRRYDFSTNSLPFLIHAFGITNQKPHRALGDALANFELYRHLAGGFEIDQPTVGDWLQAQGKSQWS